MNKYIKKLSIISSIMALSLLLFVISESSNQDSSIGYEYIFLIPTVFLFMLMLFRLNEVKNNRFLAILLIILGIKYFVTPIFMIITNNYSAMMNDVVTTRASREIAVMFTLYEILSVMFFIKIAFKNNRNTSNTLNKFRLNNSILIISILIGLIGIIIYPQNLETFSIVLFNSSKYISNKGTFAVIFFYFTSFMQVFFMLWTINLFKSKKYSISRMLIIFIVAIANIVLLWSENRMIIFITGISTLFLIVDIFPKYKKTFFLTMLSVMVTVVLFLTIYRYSGVSSTFIDDNILESAFGFSKISWQFQIYFSGVDTLAASIETSKIFVNTINLDTLVIDTFSGVNFIRQLGYFVNNYEISTTYLFNLFASNGYNPGLIIPLSGQGIIYFGYFLSPLLSVIFIFTLAKAERTSRNTNDLGLKYLLLFLSANLVFFPIYNYTILIQNLFNRVIPLAIILVINKYIK